MTTFLRAAAALVIGLALLGAPTGAHAETAPETTPGAGHGAAQPTGRTGVTAADVAAARDVRTAAGVRVRPPGSAVAASWSSGTVAAGATQSWVWNNANPHSRAYQVGFNGSFITPQDKACHFILVRSSYVKYASGERKFFFVIQNTGVAACPTTIVLAGLDGIVMATPTLGPGDQQEWWWNNSSPAFGYLAGVNQVSPGSGLTCQYEIRRPFYRIGATGDFEFHFTLVNVGSTTCTAELRLGWQAETVSAPLDSPVPPFQGMPRGRYLAQEWVLPLTDTAILPVVYGMGPNTCKLTVLDTIYRQYTAPVGGTRRELRVGTVNDGPVDCVPAPQIRLGLAVLTG